MKLFKEFALLISRSWAVPIQQLRKELGLSYEPDPLFEGKYSLPLVLALFSLVLGIPQPDWPPQTLLTGFTFYDYLSPGSGLPSELEEFLETGEPPVVFTLGSNSYNERSCNIAVFKPMKYTTPNTVRFRVVGENFGRVETSPNASLQDLSVCRLSFRTVLTPLPTPYSLP